MTAIDLETKVAFLRRAEAYGDGSAQVEAIETHMSWVFLTDRFAYKLKKPIHYDRLDFSTAKLRRFYCDEEVRLNRRLAARVYRGTVALTMEADSAELALGGTGEPIDWLVHMERLPQHRMLSRLFECGSVARSEVRPIAVRLADFFRSARPVSIATPEYCKRLEEGIETDRRELSSPEFRLPSDRIDSIASKQLAFLKAHAPDLDQRVRDHRIVEGHGDLRPEHICLTSDPVIIDCLEFCQELRELDPADELAFLGLECERLGQPRVGAWFLEAYEERTGDRIPRTLLSFYRSYRILRRAKIAAWHLREPTVSDPGRFAAKARHYLELAS